MGADGGLLRRGRTGEPGSLAGFAGGRGMDGLGMDSVGMDGLADAEDASIFTSAGLAGFLAGVRTVADKECARAWRPHSAAQHGWIRTVDGKPAGSDGL